MKKNKISIVGYSGHSYVCLDIMNLTNMNVIGYYDKTEKIKNPYKLNFLGSEENASNNEKIFISIGDNKIRKNIYEKLLELNKNLDLSIKHPSSIISENVIIENQVVISASAVINSSAKVAKGVIINTSAIVEHECTIGEFSHIAPSATLCGNVSIGKSCLIGANSVILPNINIGNNVIVGAGCRGTKDVNSNTIFYQKSINYIKNEI